MSQEEAEQLVTNKWQTTTELLKKCQTNRHNLLRALNKLFKFGEVFRKEVRTGHNKITTYSWKKK